MVELKKLVSENEGLDLKIKTNAKGVDAINQTVRNGLKSAIVDAIVSDLASNLGDIAQVGRTSDGVAVEVEIGGEIITFTMDAVIKPLDYDFEDETADFQDILDERIAKEQERLAKKNKKK